MREYAYLMTFVLHFPFVINYKLEGVVTSFQRLHETRSYSHFLD